VVACLSAAGSRLKRKHSSAFKNQHAPFAEPVVSGKVEMQQQPARACIGILQESSDIKKNTPRPFLGEGYFKKQ
jgi:hypothetical protein